jgi:hypothetical protein
VPHLDARERVQVELQTRERVVVGGQPAGLVVDDLPRSVREPVDRVDPALDRDALERERNGRSA